MYYFRLKIKIFKFSLFYFELKEMFGELKLQKPASVELTGFKLEG